MTAHWGMLDPAAVQGAEVLQRLAFRQALSGLESRIKIFMSLPFASLDSMSLQSRLDAIGRESTDAATEVRSWML